jgi:hypothetical protein
MEKAPAAPVLKEAMLGGNNPTRFMLAVSDGDAGLHVYQISNQIMSMSRIGEVSRVKKARIDCQHVIVDTERPVLGQACPSSPHFSVKPSVNRNPLPVPFGLSKLQLNIPIGLVLRNLQRFEMNLCCHWYGKLSMPPRSLQISPSFGYVTQVIKVQLKYLGIKTRPSIDTVLMFQQVVV